MKPFNSHHLESYPTKPVIVKNLSFEPNIWCHCQRENIWTKPNNGTRYVDVEESTSYSTDVRTRRRNQSVHVRLRCSICVTNVILSSNFILSASVTLSQEHAAILISKHNESPWERGMSRVLTRTKYVDWNLRVPIVKRPILSRSIGAKFLEEHVGKHWAPETRTTWLVRLPKIPQSKSWLVSGPTPIKRMRP